MSNTRESQRSTLCANAMHGPHSPMKVPKPSLGTQTRPDRLRGEPRQEEPFHVLTPLALTPTRADLFSRKVSSHESHELRQCFIVMKVTHCHQSPMNGPKHFLGTQTPPRRCLGTWDTNKNLLAPAEIGTRPGPGPEIAPDLSRSHSVLTPQVQFANIDLGHIQIQYFQCLEMTFSSGNLSAQH